MIDWLGKNFQKKLKMSPCEPVSEVRWKDGEKFASKFKHKLTQVMNRKLKHVQCDY